MYVCAFVLTSLDVAKTLRNEQVQTKILIHTTACLLPSWRSSNPNLSLYVYFVTLYMFVFDISSCQYLQENLEYTIGQDLQDQAHDQVDTPKLMLPHLHVFYIPEFFPQPVQVWQSMMMMTLI